MKASKGKGKRHWRRLSHKKAELDALRNEINVTPLVDVCLVLLIIFMVVTPLMARGKEVKMPKTQHHSLDDDKQQPVVAMDEEGGIYFDREKVASYDELKEKVQQAWAAKPQISGKVFVKAAVELPYGKVYPMIMAIHELGVESIDLGSNEIKPGDKI
jgi:biopolymer transport protein TolR